MSVIAIAAGWCKTEDACRSACETTGWTHLVAGSYTLAQRDGNPGCTYVDRLCDGSTVNNKGMPNLGLTNPDLNHALDDMRKLCEQSSRQFVISVAGTELRDLGLAARIACNHASIIEINLSCPNTGGRIISMSPEDVSEARAHVVISVALHMDAMESKTTWPELWWKVSPHTDPHTRMRIAHALFDTFERYPGKQCLVACNTLPMVRWSHPDIVGGLGGPAVYELNRANALHYVQLCAEMAPYVDVLGCGGISTRQRADEYMRGGCAGVQVASAVHVNGVRIMETIGA